MNLKKSALSESLTHCSTHQRRRIFYGFGLGLLSSLFVFFMIFLTDSYQVPLLNPVFQGFNNLGSLNDNTANLFSWSFSFSTTSCFSRCSTLHTGSVHNVSSQKLDHMVLTETGKGHLSKNGGNGNLINFSRKGGVLGDAHQESRDFSKNLENVGTIGEQSLIKDEAITYGNNMTANVSQFDAIDKQLKLPKVKDVGNLYLGELSAKDPLVLGRVNNGLLMNECDIFNGRWIKDSMDPYYPPGSCPYIDRDFNCQLNKRPDDDYLRWKWQPYDCDIPRLNATEFLERLRGKKLVFVGDSLNRNMWESLVCILWQSIIEKTRVREISGRREFKKSSFYAFKFEDYNCTIDFISSKFLVKESSFNGINGTFDSLRLDMMDQVTESYKDADILIFNTGHWWTHEKTSRGENYYQEGDYVHPKLKVLEAFKKALTTWAKWVDQTIDPNRTKVIFRGYSVTHFKGGRWNSGGKCHTETEPILNQTHLVHYPPKMRAVEHVIQEMKTPVTYLNISRLTDYRKDGHPSIYRREYKTLDEQNAAVNAQDCSHWCLPGVPDTWNELLYFFLLNSDHGSSIT